MYNNGILENDKLIRWYHIKNQPYKFRTRKWVKINDESQRMHIANSDIKFRTLMIR